MPGTRLLDGLAKPSQAWRMWHTMRLQPLGLQRLDVVNGSAAAMVQQFLTAQLG